MIFKNKQKQTYLYEQLKKNGLIFMGDKYEEIKG